MVRIDLSMLLVIQLFICNQGGREVIGRIVVLYDSSWCLNTGSCSFHLGVVRKQSGDRENTEFSICKLAPI